MRRGGLALPCCLFRPLLSVRGNLHIDLGNGFYVTQVAVKDGVVCKSY